MLVVGKKAPAIKLLDQDGNTVTLASYAGRRVLVYFYPKADTPGCTQQSCGLRDIAKKIGDTAIVGISPDAPAKQKKFADKFDLPFPLLSDPDHTVSEAYGVWKEKSMYGRKYMGVVRSTVVIDAQGVVRAVFSPVNMKTHLKDLHEAVKACA